MQAAIQQLADKLAVKLGIIHENLANLKTQIASGTIDGAIRDAKQLENSAYNMVRLLQDMEELQDDELSQDEIEQRLFEMQVYTR